MKEMFKQNRLIFIKKLPEFSIDDKETEGSLPNNKDGEISESLDLRREFSENISQPKENLQEPLEEEEEIKFKETIRRFLKGCCLHLSYKISPHPVQLKENSVIISLEKKPQNQNFARIEVAKPLLLSMSNMSDSMISSYTGSRDDNTIKIYDITGRVIVDADTLEDKLYKANKIFLDFNRDSNSILPYNLRKQKYTVEGISQNEGIIYLRKKDDNDSLYKFDTNTKVLKKITRDGNSESILG